MCNIYYLQVQNIHEKNYNWCAQTTLILEPGVLVSCDQLGENTDFLITRAKAVLRFKDGRISYISVLHISFKGGKQDF